MLARNSGKRQESARILGEFPGANPRIDLYSGLPRPGPRAPIAHEGGTHGIRTL